MTDAPIRVILADDHAVVRAGIRQFLEHANDLQVVGEATDGLAAQDLIRTARPDVAVLDIQMPEASGIEVTRWIRANMRQVGILVLTAYDDDPYVRAVLQAGAHGYVLKTAPPAEIIQAVRDVHAGKSALDATIARKLIERIVNQPAEVENLSQRELDVLILVARGYTNKAVAHQLSISDRTVQGHPAHIFDKLHASSRTEAVMRAVSLGWIPPDIGTIGED